MGGLPTCLFSNCEWPFRTPPGVALQPTLTTSLEGNSNQWHPTRTNNDPQQPTTSNNVLQRPTLTNGQQYPPTSGLWCILLHCIFALNWPVHTCSCLLVNFGSPCTLVLPMVRALWCNASGRGPPCLKKKVPTNHSDQPQLPTITKNNNQQPGPRTATGNGGKQQQPSNRP